MSFTIGADPELFVRKDGKPVSAYGLIKGTKAEPFPVPNGAYQVDGMAVEFNVDPTPLMGNNFSTFDSRITDVVSSLRKAVKDVDPRNTLNIIPVQEFSEEYLAAQPIAAKDLGCDPDYNAYTGEVNPRPNGEVLFRTAAGHIHIGWGSDIPVDHPDHIEICRNAVKRLDGYVGLFMTIIDSESRRRELYGKAGAFRPKPYGVEYRTPSNVWLSHVGRRRAIFELCQLAVNSLRSKKTVERIFNLTQDQIREIIDTGDWQRALVAMTYVADNTWGSQKWMTQVRKEGNIRAQYEQKEKADA
jgi:hypothetical protein